MKIVKIEKIGEDEYLATSPECPDCGEDTTVTMTGGKVFAYRNGMMAHEVFPDLSAGMRERFISGICPDCWELVFG